MKMFADCWYGKKCRYADINIGTSLGFWLHTVLEAPGVPVTGSPSILKCYH